MVTFHLLNFGCRASQADGAALKQQLLQAGLAEAASVAQSHVAVLNTCTVTAAADAEVRQIVRRIHRQNPGCRILVTGCYAQRAPQEIAELAGVTWVVGNSHKHLVTDVLAGSMRSGIPDPESPAKAPPGLVQIQAKSPAPALMSSAKSTPQTPDSGLPTPDSPQVLVGEIAEEFHFSPVFPDDRTRPTLKVQDGCNARCSFCIIPEVRGRSRSLAPHTVIEQVRELVGNGYQEIVLSGINLGRYGRELDLRCTFLELLERILGETSLPRLRVSSIEPMDVIAELIRLVAREPRLAQHFHVPLQSGCDRILRLMNRRYWAAQYAERLLAIREQIPNCGIGADVMVGFPGETDHDHATSARFIESLPFTYLHIFPYSARPGTPAAARPGQVNGRVARERSQEIRSLLALKRQAFLAAQVGQRISALTLDEADQGARIALTTNYLRVALPGSDLQPNRLADVWIGRAQGGLPYGYPVR
jgi:threonylcarbamoyladenosine tRNA methylthiotransferase MtaB